MWSGLRSCPKEVSRSKQREAGDTAGLIGLEERSKN